MSERLAEVLSVRWGSITARRERARGREDARYAAPVRRELGKERWKGADWCGQGRQMRGAVAFAAPPAIAPVCGQAAAGDALATCYLGR